MIQDPPRNLAGAMPQPTEAHEPHPATPEHLTPQQAALHALGYTRDASTAAMNACEQLLRIAKQRDEPATMNTVTINAGGTGPYTVVDRTHFIAKSLGVYNPGTAPVFVGVGGVSATPASRAISVPGQAAAVFPVYVKEDLELGCDPAVLGAATAIVYVFRYTSVQQLFLGDIL